MFFRLLLIISSLVTVILAVPSIRISDPPVSIFQEDTVTFTFTLLSPYDTSTLKSSTLYFSLNSVGNTIEGHNNRGVYVQANINGSKKSLLIPPRAPGSNTSNQLPVGIIYYIIVCMDEKGNKLYSSELPLLVETSQKPVITSPDVSVNTTMPTISWQPVKDVPAYHVILSDQPISFDQDTYDISGVSIVWQAITTSTSITYGTPDPSGAFTGLTAPPLTTGINYTLIVFNNYDGQSMNATSQKTQDFRIFKIDIQDTITLIPPRNIFPGAGDTLKTGDFSSITFNWTDSIAEANTYSLYLYSEELYPGFDNPILIPVWQVETTDTSAVLNALETLNNRRYVYKVFANAASGNNVVGDTSSFFYERKEKKVNFYVKTFTAIGSGIDTISLSDVNVEVRAINRSQDVLPLVTDEDGWATRAFVLGEYDFVFSKSGYIDVSSSLTLNDSGSSNGVSLTAYLEPFAVQISAKVVDQSSIAITGATVTAIDDFGRKYTGKTNAQGIFKLGLTAGQYIIKAEHSDYYSEYDTTVSLVSGDYTILNDFFLEKIQTYLMGSVKSDMGQALSRVSITVRDTLGNIVQETLTDAVGSFSTPLKRGQYVVITEKAGFSMARKQFLLLGTQNISMTLSAGASLINGRVLGKISMVDSTVYSPLSGAQVTVRALEGGDEVQVKTNISGDYSLSIKTIGEFSITVSFPQQAYSVTEYIEITEPKSTITHNTILLMFAHIQGILRLNPYAEASADDISISLVDSLTHSPIQQIVPQPEDSSFTFIFESVPNGTYTLVAGLPGYGQISEPMITVANSRWVRTPQIELRQSTKIRKFIMQYRQEEVFGTIKVFTPYTFSIPSGQTLNNAAFGTYTLNAIPDNDSIIPIKELRFVIDTSSAEDSVLIFDFPFYHIPENKDYVNGNPSIAFRKTANQIIDSAFLVFGYNAPQDTVRFNNAEEVMIDPGTSGGRLVYYFMIYSGGLKYANSAPGSQFQIMVTPSTALTYVQFDKTDSIVSIPVKTRIKITAQGFDPMGNSLDQAIDENGEIEWQTQGNSLLTFHNKEGRTAEISASKETDEPIEIKAIITLNNVVVSNTIFIHPVSGTINKLSMTSSKSKNMDLLPSDRISFFVSGWDTTLSPPLRLEPNPQFILFPSTAGTVENGKLVIDSSFIGPLRISAKHKSGTVVVTTELGIEKPEILRGVNVGHIISGTRDSIVLIHDSCFEIVIPPDTLENNQSFLKVYKRIISSRYTSTKDHELKGNLYEIIDFLGARRRQPVLLKICLPSLEFDQNAAIRVYSDSALGWLDYPISSTKDTSSFGEIGLSIEWKHGAGYYYGLLTDAIPLSLSQFNIIPNPFSPLVKAERDGNTEYGTRIFFTPHSNKSDRVTIIIKIYNMRGELIRVLENLRSVPKTVVEYYWDGKTNEGRWARNGRYLVVVLVKETVEKKFKKYIKQMVLYK
ncbi:MAG: carboxypeptidase regulatory-like domain-containing protein [Fibrobacteria bacterium]|nr:carboxypeptidase regulatory-like domain-containing protein [Fibrobacteria bacterium]